MAEQRTHRIRSGMTRRFFSIRSLLLFIAAMGIMLGYQEWKRQRYENAVWSIKLNGGTFVNEWLDPIGPNFFWRESIEQEWDRKNSNAVYINEIRHGKLLTFLRRINLATRRYDFLILCGELDQGTFLQLARVEPLRMISLDCCKFSRDDLSLLLMTKGLEDISVKFLADDYDSDTFSSLATANVTVRLTVLFDMDQPIDTALIDSIKSEIPRANVECWRGDRHVFLGIMIDPLNQ